MAEMGRPKGFTVELLKKAFEEYKKEVKDNPHTFIDYVGKDAIKVEKTLEKPLTKVGFEVFCFQNYSDVSEYLRNRRGDSYKNFAHIVAYIEGEIAKDQISGGMIGIYNANLTARLNKLSEAQDITVNSIKKDIADLFPEVDTE